MSGVRQQEFSELTSYSSPSPEPQSQAVFDESTETSIPRDRDILSINLGNIVDGDEQQLTALDGERILEASYLERLNALAPEALAAAGSEAAAEIQIDDFLPVELYVSRSHTPSLNAEAVSLVFESLSPPPPAPSPALEEEPAPAHAPSPVAEEEFSFYSSSTSPLFSYQNTYTHSDLDHLEDGAVRIRTSGSFVEKENARAAARAALGSAPNSP